MPKKIGKVLIRAGVVILCLGGAALADEFEQVSSPRLHRRVASHRIVVREHVLGPIHIMPACVEVAWWGLMKCVPRPILYPPYPLPDEIAWKTLPRVRGPYGELFTLPYGP